MIWCGRSILHGIVCSGVCYRKVWYMIWCGRTILNGIVYYGV